jgi:hypothetical protein
VVGERGGGGDSGGGRKARSNREKSRVRVEIGNGGDCG